MDLSSVTSSKNIPKMASPTLEIRNNYYVVKTGLLYNYYPIKVQAGQPEDSIIRFEKAPPVLMEGIVILNKKAYQVTVQDLMRQVIRKSREVVVAKRDKVNGKANPAVDTSTVREAVQHSEQQGASRKAPVEIQQVADDAWAEQIGALLDTFAAKEGEEWEIADSA